MKIAEIAERAPVTVEQLWPSSMTRSQFISRAKFREALTAASHVMRESLRPIQPSPAPVRTPAPDLDLAAFIPLMLRFVDAVGVPRMYAPDAKGPTLIEVAKADGRITIHLHHRVPHTKERVEQACDAMAQMLELMGCKVLFRDVVHGRTLVGWRATLRVSAPRAEASARWTQTPSTSLSQRAAR